VFFANLMLFCCFFATNFSDCSVLKGAYGVGTQNALFTSLIIVVALKELHHAQENFYDFIIYSAYGFGVIGL
jgi:hypothetical protein